MKEGNGLDYPRFILRFSEKWPITQSNAFRSYSQDLELFVIIHDLVVVKVGFALQKTVSV